MKRLLIIVACLLATSLAQADPIDRQKAMQMAAEFLKDKPGSLYLTDVTTRARVGARRAAQTQTEVPYHVFNRGNNQGFVIVSGDDRAPEVLGYCDSGNFDYDQMPENMRWWLDNCEAQINDLRINNRRAPRRAEAHPKVDELLTCAWNQDYPYNLECPNYFGKGTSVTGCVATAMAQILYYQRSKSTDRTLADMPDYDGTTSDPNFGKLHVSGIPAGEPLDWDNMLDRYTSSATEAQRTAVAKLMHCCGVSVYMDYTNSASGAYSSNVAPALKKYFGYGSSVRYVTPDSYTNDQWDELLYNEIAERRPFYISGANSTVGHAFVCDGYDGDRHYHINWGWGGTSNGYYLLSNLSPGSQGIGGSSNGYNSYIEVVIGIEPENFTDMAIKFEEARVKTLCVENWDTNGDGELSYGEAAAVTDLGTVFQGITIRQFTELRNFTSLTSIADGAFESCRLLANIILPKNVTRIGDKAFNGCRSITDLNLPSGITSIGDSAFCGCRALTAVTLPEGLTRIGAGTFENCASITTIDIPSNVSSIGTSAFSGCTRITSVEVHVTDPALIPLGNDVFKGVKQASATLTVAQGGKPLFSEADQWKEFGTIKEKRLQPETEFTAMPVGRIVYLYNVGTERYLSRGEAYETQAVAGYSPMRFVMRHREDMAADTYEIFSDETGKYGHLLYRTNQDESVGREVKATFVDGSAGKSALWVVKSVGENRYTIQAPSSTSDYTAGQYLGVLPSHQSAAATPTYGAYYDIPYSQYPEECQWMFVDVEANFGNYEAAVRLGKLLERAKASHVYAERETAIYDDMNSTLDELKLAQRSLRGKLGLIDFADPFAEKVCLDNFDLDADGEISFTEASMTSNIGNLFYSNNMSTFDELQYFGLETLYAQSFEGCSELTSIRLPKTVTTAYYYAFRGCSKLEEIEFSQYLSTLGYGCFDGCKSLRTIRLASPDPSSIQVTDDSFVGLDRSKVTLYVPFGCKQKYASAPVWKDFYDIREYRTDAVPTRSPLTVDTNVYVLNVGTSRYLSKGEAYGTQSVVAPQGMRYQLKRNASMPEGTYYLACPDLTTTGKILFRTDTDTKVGEGVKACFVDGTLTSKAYWTVRQVADNVYTISVPQADEEQDEGRQYLGINTYHDTNVTYPTYGTYWDIDYGTYTANCQWAFVLEEDMQAANALDELVQQLAELLSKAEARDIDAAEEQATYDNPVSTADDFSAAITSLRIKLGIISFEDATAERLCTAAFDVDMDGVLTFEEVESITDLGTVFNAATTLRSFPELRYFTALQTVDANAFLGCSQLQTIYLPCQLTSLDSKSFSRCSSLKYIAMPTGQLSAVDASEAALPNSGLTLFVNADDTEACRQHPIWGKYAVSTYTGIPVVTAKNDTTTYGRRLTSYSYTVEGAPITGTPAVSCEATATSPVGNYDIAVASGSVITEGVVYVPGFLTIDPASVTVTARSYTRQAGEPNPDFAVTYNRFYNSENASVLLHQPVIECDADEQSPAGEYEIRVSGAEAENYVFTYVSGKLTVEGTVDAIETLQADDLSSTQPIYDLQGRRLSVPAKQLPRGTYIVGGRKVFIR